MTRGERGGESCHAHHHNRDNRLSQITGDRVRPWRMALSRLPHAAIEHQRRVPGATCPGTTGRSPGWRSRGSGRRASRAASTSAAAQIHGTRHVAAGVDLQLDARPARAAAAARRAPAPRSRLAGRGAGSASSARSASRVSRNGAGRRRRPAHRTRAGRARSARRPRRPAGRAWAVAGHHPRRVDQVERKRLPDERARVNGGHITSIGRQSGESIDRAAARCGAASSRPVWWSIGATASSTAVATSRSRGS